MKTEKHEADIIAVSVQAERDVRQILYLLRIEVFQNTRAAQDDPGCEVCQTVDAKDRGKDQPENAARSARFFTSIRISPAPPTRNSDSCAMMFVAVAAGSPDTISFERTDTSAKKPATMMNR